jgi:error-prone DNA polymerase
MPKGPAVRLGLKYVHGLREMVGQRIARERRQQRFTSLADFHARVEPNQREREALATSGALAALGGHRRAALWQIEALGRSGHLFARVSDEAPSPLPAMTPDEDMLAELRTTAVATGPHPVSFLRARLEHMGVTRAVDLDGVSDGAQVRIGGLVVVRQRPGTAKGFVFITLEDETGFSNAIVHPRVFEQWRPVILRHPTLAIEGKVQNREGVILVQAARFAPVSGDPLTEREGISRDFR